jgi:hypothetical protein
MAHEHSHGEAGGTYFLDQLFTILACGGVGLVAVMMYATDFLGRMLVPMFYVPVLLGGAALLVMVTLRAVAVWQLAGARKAEVPSHDHGPDHGHAHAHAHSHGHEHAHDDCGHEHSHGDDCGHDHGKAHDHAHAGGDDHGHDHGWAPWRYMVIAIPVFLFFLGLPRDGLTENQLRGTGGDLKASPNRQALSFMVGGPALTKALRKTQPSRQLLAFNELTQAAALPVRQEAYEGDIGVLRGQYIKKSDFEFTLLRVDRTCCAADETLLEIRIIAPEPIQGLKTEDWVQVEGVISFQQNERGKWIPVITLKSNDDIIPTEKVNNTKSF